MHGAPPGLHTRDNPGLWISCFWDSLAEEFVHNVDSTRTHCQDHRLSESESSSLLYVMNIMEVGTRGG